MDLYQIIAVYAEFGIDITMKEAVEDLVHAKGGNADETTIEKRIRGYAQQEARERQADCREAMEFQSNYE